MLPTVAIIGRPNVGKSSLLNMLAGRRISIVDPTAGVTRDRVSVRIELPIDSPDDPKRYCELVDTGGYGVYSGDPNWATLTTDVERQILYAVKEAKLILFVIDAQTGLTPLDEEVARLLRSNDITDERVLVIANKVDDPRHEPQAAEALALGFGQPHATSTTNKRGRYELLEIIADRMGEESAVEQKEDEMMLAIVGRRNAGKSTLVNTLAGGDRVIASEIAGTTRDSVDVRFEVDGRSLVAIDTAGVRKRKSIEDDVEYYSMHRALRSIRRADVVVLLIDATEPISQLDKQLGAEIEKHFKPCVIVMNKWDLVPPQQRTGEYETYIEDHLPGLSHCPIVFISAKNNDNVRGLLQTARELHVQAGQRVPTGKLNEVVQEILERRGPSPKLGTQAKVFYVTMPATHPPTIALFVNHPKLFDQRYQRYIINRFREELPYAEVPIKLLIRGRRRED